MVVLLLSAIMPVTGRNSTYLSCSDFPSHLCNTNQRWRGVSFGSQAAVAVKCEPRPLGATNGHMTTLRRTTVQSAEETLLACRRTDRVRPGNLASNDFKRIEVCSVVGGEISGL